MANLLLSPDLLEDVNYESPPPCFVSGEIVVDGTDLSFLLRLVDNAAADSTFAASGTITASSLNPMYLCVKNNLGDVLWSAPLPDGVPTEVSFDVAIPDGVKSAIGIYNGNSGAFDTLVFINTMTANITPSGLAVPTSYNCDCDDDFPTETLAELRQKVLIEMGYSAQLASPPANVVLKINQALQYAQKFAFSEFYDSKLERFFTWDMVEGVRFYDIPQNIDECTKKLNIHRITWVGVQENNDRWYPLVFGIPPEFYTEPQITTRPNRYEIRQCIEVWPAPGSDLYRLRIKGEFGLLPFTEDTHVTTIDPDVIFYGACFRLMRRRGDADADDYAAMQQRRMEQITEAMHFTARYVPNSSVQTDDARPIFLPLGDES